jgi:PAS domain S-box-containing protein
MEKIKILVVEDEAIIATSLQKQLENYGYIVPSVEATGEEAIKKVSEDGIDLVLMDIVLLGEMDGIEAADQIRSRFDVPVIYLTAYADETILERAKITEPFGYIIKPFEDRELHSAIQMALYKHNMEKRLREKEKWLSTILNGIGDAVVATDTKENVIFINQVAEKLTGWKEEDATGRPLEEVFNIVNEETGEDVENPVKKVLRDGAVIGPANHTILITREGNKIPIDNSGSPIRDDKGNIIGVVLVFHDITRRKKSDELILQSKQDWENTFNTITDMVTVHDKDFNIIKANKAAEKILNLPLLKSTETKCFKYYHGTDVPPERCPSCQCLKTEKPAVFEIFEPHLNMFIEIRAIPRFDEKNRLVGLIHVVRDITERKKTEEELRRHRNELQELVKERTAEVIKANKQLQEEIVMHKQSEERKGQLLEQVENINQELKDFAYIVSHDLKAPLRAINTIANWISTDYTDKLDEEGKEHLNLLVRRVHRMHALINGILEYSKVGRIKEKKVKVDLEEVVREVIDTIAPPGNINIRVDGELPSIFCEKTRISEVFQNLLSNAVNYMDKTEGVIRIGCIEDDGYWKFNVSDNGPGIEEKYFEKIFQIFQTLSPVDEHESTGIGLTLVKKIITMYGGEIWIESEVGRGSTFFFTLPKEQKTAYGR